MHIYQILLRPSENRMVIIYEDAVGNRQNIVLDTASNAQAAALVTQCQQLLPADTANPAKEEILKEIANLEDRVTQLKAAIGIA